MTLSTAITKAYELKWSFVNSFHVEFDFKPDKFGKMPFFQFTQDDLNMTIVSLNTPELSNSPIDVWIADRWRTQNARDNLYRFSITFRDVSQMILYTEWTKMYMNTRNQYFDNQCMKITVTKDADWVSQGPRKIMELDNTIIESISQISFSNNTQNEIAEFTVNFRCTKPSFY